MNQLINAMGRIVIQASAVYATAPTPAAKQAAMIAWDAASVAYERAVAAYKQAVAV